MTDKKVWLITGADAISFAEQKVADLQEQIDTYRNMSTSLALNNLQPTEDRR